MTDKTKTTIACTIAALGFIALGFSAGKIPISKTKTVVQKMMPDSSIYSGEMYRKIKEGKGILVMPDQSYYEGMFHNDLKDGYGQEHNADGSSYDGFYQEGKFCGEGTLTKDGYQYSGTWHLDTLKEGTIRCDQFIYNGPLEDLLPDGYGLMEYKNGDKYSGNFEKGYKTGSGRLTHPDGTFEYGFWEKGRLKRSPGKEFTDGDKIYGIDVSHHQEEIDWDQLSLFTDAAGDVFYRKSKGQHDYPVPVSFVILKATEKDNFVDDRYQEYADEADRHHIRKGAYHFFRYDVEAEDQMKNFLSNSRYDDGDLPPVLDVELTHPQANRIGQENLVKRVKECLEIIERERGVRPILYSSKSYFTSYLDDPQLQKYDKWVARYGASDPGIDPYLIWQYTSKGELAGMDPTEDIDIDIFNGSVKEFNRYIEKHTSSIF